MRERSLRSYVDGHYKSERSETTGVSRPVGLRGPESFSVLLGVFRNDDYDQDVSLAQVFWTREGGPGQPERFFAVANRPLSVAADFADFGGSTVALRKRLRAAGVRVYDHFPEYGRDFRRRLGIESERAMELFHQTVSMKSVGNLNDFVRSHMLEPFDAREWVAKLVAHFDDLTRAHDAVVKARSQLNELSPLLAECDTYDVLGEEITAMEAERTALPYFFAQHRAGLLTDRIAARDRDVAARQREKQDREAAVALLNDRRQALLLERAGHGGDRVGQLERQIGEAEQLRDQRRKRADRFNELLGQAELPTVERAEQFETRLAEVTAAAAHMEQAEVALRDRADQIAINRNEVQQECDELNAELVSLRSRRSSIPANSLALRRRLCDEARVPEQELPFAGELIQVRPEHAEWEGAAERVLRGCGLSLLVPDEHYRTVSEWINVNHLGGRLVYYRVPPTVTPGPSPGTWGKSDPGEQAGDCRYRAVSLA